MSLKFHFRHVAALLLMCFFVGYVYAQPKVFRSDRPSWVHVPQILNLKQNPREVSDGYYLKLYDYQIHAELEAHYVHIVRSITSEAGIQNGSEVWVNFSPDHQKLVFHEVSIIRNGERQNRLNLSKFKVIATEQEASSYIYNSGYSAYLILDDVRVGDQIEYSYSLRGANPVFKGKFFEDIYLQIGVPIVQLYASLLVSPDRDIRMKEFNKAQKPRRTTHNGLTKFEWEDQKIGVTKQEPNRPGWYNDYRHIQITEYKDWDEVSVWARSINAPPAVLKGPLLRKATLLMNESGANIKRYADKAIRFVQDDIRYTGIEIGEYSHRANHPEKVYNQRYGDCKDKSLLLVTLLRHADIEASIAFMHTELGSYIEDHLPSPAAFNHAVVYFLIDEKPYWIDPTISYQGGTLDSRSFPHNGTALLLNDDDIKMIPMRFEGEGNINSIETYTVEEEDKSNAKLKVVTKYTGWQADVIRSYTANKSLYDIESGYLNYYLKLYPSIEPRDSVRINDNRQQNEILIEENYFVPAFLKKNAENDRYDVSFYASMIYERLPSSEGKRISPIAVPYPADIEYTVRVVSPFDFRHKKTTFFLDRENYLFGSSTKAEADTLTLNYQFKYHSPEISAKASATYAADLKEIEDKELSFFISLPSLDPASKDTISWGAVLFSMISLVTFALIGYQIYKMQVQPSIQGEYELYQGLGGWLLLPLLGLIVTPIQLLAGLFSAGYFDVSIWSFTPAFTDTFAFRGLLAFELIANLLLISFSTLCLLLMIKRRTTFPKLFIGYLFLNVLVLSLDLAFFHLLGLNESIEYGGSVAEIPRAFVALAVWAPYMLRSRRVKGTFIVAQHNTKYYK